MLTPSQVETLFVDPQHLNPFAGKRVLELHLIRSAEALRADSLEFDPVTMAQMLEMGGRPRSSCCSVVRRWFKSAFGVPIRPSLPARGLFQKGCRTAQQGMEWECSDNY